MAAIDLRSALASPVSWARRLAYATAAGVFLGAVGAFGTFVAAPLENRVADWVLMFWVGTLLYPPATVAAMVAEERWGVPLWLGVGLAVTLTSLPMTLVAVWSTEWLIRPGPLPFLPTYFQVMLVALPVVTLYLVLSRRGMVDAPTAGDEPIPVVEPRFLSRLPARIGRDLLCLQMEDHYVRAHTASGSDLMLMRMRDAVAELDGLPGFQAHRSWWVANGAIAGSRTDGRRTTLILRGGLEVPVARSALPAIRQAGLLDRRAG